MALILPAAAAVIAKRKYKRALQRFRNKRAIIVSENARAGTVDKYLLYLRPFWISKKLPIGNRDHSASMYFPTFYSEDSGMDLETFLSKAIPADVSFVALGHPGDEVGAGRIATTDAEWKSDFERLATNALAICIIPSDQKGIQWEIKWLADHRYLSKCLFVMPPRANSRIEDSWKKSQEILPIRLPDYRPKGLLITMDDNGNLQEAPLSLSSPRQVLDALQRLTGGALVSNGSNNVPHRRMNPVLKWLLLWVVLSIAVCLVYYFYYIAPNAPGSRSFFAR